MHGLRLLHKFILETCTKIHNNRLAALMHMVDALLSCNKLTLVKLGRSLKGTAQLKNRIKKSDRLIGNIKLFSESKMIYKALTALLIAPCSKPIIVVDWSGVTYCNKFHMLRACIPFYGRALTIYEEVHPEHLKDNPKINKAFLKNLKNVLPINCCPIVVSDAGFKNPWFKEVFNLGWDFVGRVRSQTHVKWHNNNAWEPCKNLYVKATTKAKYLGQFLLAKSNPMACQLYLMKGKKQFREKKNLKGQKVKCSSSLKHARCNSEPWLITTSLVNTSAKKIMKIYKLRMGIEQGFRDIKNHSNGLCLSETRSTTAERLSILLLISALATFVICIYGKGCQLLNIQHQYQTNSIKNRTVLSWFSLGIIGIKQKIPLCKKLIPRILTKMIESEVCYG